MRDGGGSKFLSVSATTPSREALNDMSTKEMDDQKKLT